MDEAAQARFKIIGKSYNGPEGGKPALKTWQDVRDIDPRITLNEVKGWFKLNVDPKRQALGEIATLPQDLTTSFKRIYF
jgi:hypothetical protein